MTKFELVVGSIAELNADAIVNAANGRLARGSGVCRAIFEKSGPDLAEELQRRLPDGCEIGDAVTSPAFGLDARFIIHAVAPVYEPYEERHQLLKSAYVAIFREAKDWAAKTIAIPSLGTGVYGWLLEEATAIAKQGILEGLRNYPTLKRIIFSCYTKEAAEIYSQMFATELEYGLDLVPRCPKCSKSALPIMYGFPGPQDAADPDIYLGGCIVGLGQPNWDCRDCEIEFA